MCFQTYGLQKTWLDKCLRSPASEEPSRSNMVNGSKHCLKLNDRRCIFELTHSEKTWLDKRLKSTLSEESLTSNMINGLKHCSKLNDSIFTIFFDPCEANSGLKSLSDRYAVCEDYLLNY